MHFHSFNAPGSRITIYSDRMGGGIFCTQTAENAGININGHMTFGNRGYSGYDGIHEVAGLPNRLLKTTLPILNAAMSTSSLSFRTTDAGVNAENDHGNIGQITAFQSLY